MKTTRLEFFSDAVMGVIITIMVLELHVPEGASWHDLQEVAPSFLIYLLSFQVIGIYWNNHHHLFKGAETITTKVVWANLNLLFWLSLIPFFTAWFGEHHDQAAPTAAFGMVLLCAALASNFLRQIVTKTSSASKTAQPKTGDYRGLVTIVSYLVAVGLAFVAPWASITLYVLVGALWFIPERRFVFKS